MVTIMLMKCLVSYCISKKMEEMLTSMLDAQHFLFTNICLVVSCKFRVYFFITAQIAKDARSIYIALAGQFRQSGQH